MIALRIIFYASCIIQNSFRCLFLWDENHFELINSVLRLGNQKLKLTHSQYAKNVRSCVLVSWPWWTNSMCQLVIWSIIDMAMDSFFYYLFQNNIKTWHHFSYFIIVKCYIMHYSPGQRKNNVYCKQRIWNI